MNKLRGHVADEADDSVCEQSCALEEHDSEDSPEDRLRDVHAGFANRVLRVALELPGRRDRALGVEDGGEARWRLALVLHRHLLAELLVVDLSRTLHRDFLVLADGLSAWVHVAADLSLEVLIEGHGVDRSGALVRHAYARWTGTAALKAGHGFAGRGLLCGSKVGYAVLLAAVLSKMIFACARERVFAERKSVGITAASR